MSDFFTRSSTPAFRSAGSSSAIRTEFDGISAGFDKLAPLTGNAGKFVYVNAGANAYAASANLYEVSGNIGVGTATPDAKLTVVSSGQTVVRLRGGTSAGQGAAYYVRAATSSGTLFAAGDSSAILGDSPDASCSIYTAGSVPLRMVVGATEKARFHATGELVVGHNGAPAALLDLATTTSGAATIGLRIGYSANHYGFRLANESNAGSYAAGQLKIQRGDTSTWLDCLTFDNSGNGIFSLNTSAPALTVNQQMVINLTSDTNLRISVRGSDGVTRTANITLS